MIGLLGVVLAVGISLAWYLPCVKAQGKNRVLQRKDYINTFLLYGLAFTCLLIIVTEIVFDLVISQTGLSGLAKDIFEDFFRAALLEEFFKFWGFRLAKERLKLHRKTDYILIAGLIGMSYGIVEKAVLGNAVGVVVGLAIPMHITWQFNQGGHYFEYEQHKADGRKEEARKEWLLAVVLPFLFHGCWDSGLDIASWCIEQKETLPQVIGGILMLVMIVLGILYTVRTIRKVIRIAKSEPLPTPQTAPAPEESA